MLIPTYQRTAILENSKSKHCLHAYVSLRVLNKLSNYMEVGRLYLWFSGYSCLKFAELLESQKSSFSTFAVLKRLN